MTKRQQQSTDKYSDAIAELRRLARDPFETPPELQKLRHRIASERTKTHRKILERIAQQAHLDLEPILEDARRHNAAKRRYVTETMKSLEERAAELAKGEKKHFHRIRAEYIKSFDGQLPIAPGSGELKFHVPIQWSSEAKPGNCNQVLGSMCGGSDLGTYEASAEIAPPGEVGVWLHSYLYSDSGDCEDTLAGRTIHDLTYSMGPPITSFAVSSVRVDLVANGVASFNLGDYGWFSEADPLYEHSFVQLDVYISQQINGEWHQWPLLSDKLFVGRGDAEARQIRSLLCGQTYPVSIAIRKPEAGGGDLLCHLQIVGSILTLGSDGRARIDFRAAEDHGIFIGGVALIGDSL